MSVYFLMDVADVDPALSVGRGVGFVNVTDLAGLSMKDLAIDLKSLGNVLELLFAIVRHSFGESLAFLATGAGEPRRD